MVTIERQYAIAFAVVEVESFVTWKWFLESLKPDLQIDNTFPWTVMTDKKKVLYLFLMMFGCPTFVMMYGCVTEMSSFRV